MEVRARFHRPNPQVIAILQKANAFSLLPQYCRLRGTRGVELRANVFYDLPNLNFDPLFVLATIDI